jgi:hypothetical protein
MRGTGVLGFLTVVAAVATGWSETPTAPASSATAAIAAYPGATTAIAAYPGMTIYQGNTLCTMGYADAASGLAFSAGHCNTDPVVRDEAGDFVGQVITSRHDPPGKIPSGPRDVVIDYEVIRLATGVEALDRALPDFVPPVQAQPAIRPQPGMSVCHIGAATGSSCGEVSAVYAGWFTMSGGDIKSFAGDSGGPVLALLPNQDPALVGIFRGTSGPNLAATTWADIVADFGLAT